MVMKKTIKISVVILHYNDFELTKNYIENLNKQKWTDISYHFIIVDNNSSDKSGKRLFDYYKDVEKVDVILSEKNLGFARGNNLGIEKAVLKYDSDLIVISNNDIIIQDTMFMQKLVCSYDTYGFDVMGPDIFSTRRGFHQSPIRKRHLSLQEIDKQIEDIDKKLRLLKIVDKLKIYNFLSWIKTKSVGNPKNCKDYDKVQYDVVLQGAFFVLSKGYMKIYPDGLYSKTFLYMEEDILNYRVKKMNLISVYDPTLHVFHLEGVSSIRKKGNRCKKFIFELEQTKLSCEVMKEYIIGEMKNE